MSEHVAVSTARRWRPPASGVIRGCWQLSRGHGSGWDRDRAFAALDAVASQTGKLYLDCADIYGGVEAMLGEWMASRGVRDEVVVHTKFVPDLDVLPRIGRAHVRDIVRRSRDRLGVPRLELVQFHWWDLGVPGWARAAEWLAELREDGLVRHVGVTNMGTAALRRLLRAGVPIVTNQVQMSLLDRRPRARLTEFCRENGVALLAYGTLAGGLLADHEGAAGPRNSRSLTKYRLIVNEVGGARVLAEVRAGVAEVAARARVTMADVAAAYVLGQEGVGAVVVGLSRRGHAANPRAARLGRRDVARLEAMVTATVPGGVYEAERNRSGPHGRIMRYNLNRRR